MDYVIGLDFGNCNSFPCFISDIDLVRSRKGGNVQDLLEVERNYGIPSVFFYSKQKAEKGTTLPLPWVCDDAVRQQAVPVGNRIRFLKRHLGETLIIDGKEFTYDEAVTKVIQYVIRNANRLLKEKTQKTSNLVALAYPVTYTEAQREHLIALTEAATLEDGTHLKVFGTITEPAAAALDYLYEHPGDKDVTTVLTYDLGGGTFDAALVSAYPEGKKTTDGNTVFYDLLDWGGIDDIGGKEFDDAVFEILRSKVPSSVDWVKPFMITKEAENIKIELSRNTGATLSLTNPMDDDVLDLEITRAEFEKATMQMVQSTIGVLKNIIQKHPKQKPDVILLTGGASHMPMIEREIRAVFPDYEIKMHRPSRAIAYGAARYAILDKQVQLKVLHDLGIRCCPRNMGEYISTYLLAGSAVPVVGEYQYFHTVNENQQRVRIKVYEAKGDHPSPEKVAADYTYVMETVLDFGHTVPLGYAFKIRMSIDKQGVLKLEAYDEANPKNPVTVTHELKNLSKNARSV